MASDLFYNRLFSLAYLATIGGIFLGYDTAIMADTVPYLRDEFPELQKSKIMQATLIFAGVGAAALGAMCGKFSGLSDKFGRKPTLIAAQILTFFGYLLTAFAPTPWLITVGRIVSGVGVGINYTTIRPYITEISQALFKVKLLNFYILPIFFGVYSAYHGRLPDEKRSFGTLYVLLACILGQFMSTLNLPESPRWLYKKGKTDDATDVLKELLPTAELYQGVQALKSSIKAELLEEEYFCSDVGISLRSIFQQSVGSICMLIFYIPPVLQFYGLASKDVAVALSFCISVLGALGSLVCMDKSDDHKVEEGYDL